MRAEGALTILCWLLAALFVCASSAAAAASASAALDAGRTLRVLERRTQAQDHPILLTVPETLYLKCLVLEAL